MDGQLVLIDDEQDDYRLDEHTREVGRRGVEAAREILQRTSELRVERPRRTRPTAA